MSDAVISLAKARPEATVQWLFLHHAGGSSYPYLQLANQLSAANEAYCLELPGRGARFMEPLQAGAAATLASILAAVRQRGLGRDKPLMLFGHSLGAELAFQLAGQLQQQAPQMQLGLVLSARVFVDPAEPGAVPEAPLSDQAILNLLQQYEGTPPEVLADATLREYVIGVMRSDLALLADLCRLPKPALALPVRVVGGDSDFRVPVARLAQWQQVFRQTITPQVFAGGHFYLFSCLEFVSWLEQCGRALLCQSGQADEAAGHPV